MVHLVKAAAPFFDYADLTEMHHEAKIDRAVGHGSGHRPGRRRRQKWTVHLERPR